MKKCPECGAKWDGSIEEKETLEDYGLCLACEKRWVKRALRSHQEMKRRENDRTH